MAAYMVKFAKIHQITTLHMYQIPMHIWWSIEVKLNMEKQKNFFFAFLNENTSNLNLYFKVTLIGC